MLSPEGLYRLSQLFLAPLPQHLRQRVLRFFLWLPQRNYNTISTPYPPLPEGDVDSSPRIRHPPHFIPEHKTRAYIFRKTKAATKTHCLYDHSEALSSFPVVADAKKYIFRMVKVHAFPLLPHNILSTEKGSAPTKAFA